MLGVIDPPVKGVRGWELITRDKIASGSATSPITISDLDSTLDKELYLTYGLRMNYVDSQSIFRVRPNADEYYGFTLPQNKLDQPLAEYWEDGAYTSRTWPKKSWTLNTGTCAQDTAWYYTGESIYSMLHTGTASNYLIAPLTYSLDSRHKTFFVTLKLNTQGASVLTPYLSILYLRYVDTNNFLRVDTYYDTGSSKQKLRFIKTEGGVTTVLASTDWLSAKWAANAVYYFRIIDTGTHVEVAVDGGIQISLTEYATSLSGTVVAGTVGVGAHQDTAVKVGQVQALNTGWGHIPASDGSRTRYISGRLWINSDIYNPGTARGHAETSMTDGLYYFHKDYSGAVIMPSFTEITSLDLTAGTGTLYGKYSLYRLIE